MPPGGLSMGSLSVSCYNLPMKSSFDKSLDELRESMIKDGQRRAIPGDEVGSMRSRKLADRQAGPMHQMLQSVVESGLGPNPKER
jgi:hypothetical protein